MAIVTQEMYVGMLAMPVYYRKNIVPGTQSVWNTLLSLEMVD